MSRGRGSPRRWPAAALVAVAVQVALVLPTNLDKLRSPAPGAPTKVEDTDLYYRYASRMLAGAVPYRDFPVEYPPLALPLFLAPRAVAAGLPGYKLAFAAEMLLCHAATVLLVAAHVGRREGPGHVPARLAWYTLAFLPLARLMVSRYDAAPALLGFAASAWWFAGRARIGGLAAAAGALVKFYPALIPLIAAPWDVARPGPARGRGLRAFVLAATLGALGWLALGGVRGVADTLAYHSGRGLEYGSLYSGAQMLAAKAAGAEIRVSRDHVSFSTVTPWTKFLVRLVPPIQLAAFLLIVATFRRRGLRDGVRYAGAAVLAFVVLGKVFSPQYLIWLLPYLAALDGPIAPRARRLFLAGCLATILAPAGFGLCSRTCVWVILAFNAKDLIFLGLLVLLIRGPLAERTEDGVGGPGVRAGR